MKDIAHRLDTYIQAHPFDSGDSDCESVLDQLYQAYDNEQIRADFHALYQAMNGKTLREMDEIIYPVCTLCRDHEKVGFWEGVKVGMLLANELSE